MFKKKIFFSTKEYISLENIDSKMVKNTVQNRISSRRSYSVTYSGTFQARCRWKSILPVAWFRIFSRRLTINRSLVVRALGIGVFGSFSTSVARRETSQRTRLMDSWPIVFAYRMIQVIYSSPPPPSNIWILDCFHWRNFTLTDGFFSSNILSFYLSF